MLNFITKFSKDATVSVVQSQAVLVILTVFGGGMFISWDNCPIYWRWLQEISIFTQASRSAIINVMDDLVYTCTTYNGVCMDSLGRVYTCDYSPSLNGQCEVSGREVLYVMQGTSREESKWVPFGYLVLIFGVFRLLELVLLCCPIERIQYLLQDHFAGISSKGILDTQLGLRRVSGQLNAYIALHRRDDEEKGMITSSSRTLPTPIRSVNNVEENDVASMHTLPVDGGTCLQWEKMSVILKSKGSVLVDKVSGTALPGRILALMGPSGAGKTTLLNALSNRTPYARLEGDVKFGNRPFLPSDLVYVPQFDEFNPNLTVLEQIQLVGDLKCADRVSMKRRLANLLSILGLADKMHTSCRELSSGELKRVSVGMGMISNPNVLFLDEPTTGLDSSAAYSIVSYLRQLCSATKVVVIMTIHQPAPMVFDLLEDLYLLEKGRLAYYGPLAAAKKYFQTLGYDCPLGINPADYYLDLVNKPPINSGDKSTWTEVYVSSTFYNQFSQVLGNTMSAHFTAIAPPPPAPPSSLSRLEILINYFSTYYYRETGIYWLRLAFLTIVALFLGTLFLQLTPNTNNISQYSGAIFFAIWTILFSAVAATGLLAADRRLAVEQVKNAVITPGVYCIAQFLVSLPGNLICAFIFQSIFHWMIDLNPEGESFVFGIFVSMGHLLLMEAFMLSVVAALKNAMLSVTFAMVILGYLFLFSGFFIAVDNMPDWISWICWITPTKVIHVHVLLIYFLMLISSMHIILLNSIHFSVTYGKSTVPKTSIFQAQLWRCQVKIF
jgi:ABC-type multidrug transport system ATPase subunit